MAATTRILIVDDEAQIRDLLALAFEDAGYVVKTAVDGRDAVAILAGEPFDVMLSDVTMPEMNGHELAQWVAAHRPATRTALMSGFDAECHECAYSPRCHLIAKPFRSREVVAFVEQVLSAA
jgi:two-component system cell cycle response regulator CpdR